LPEILFVPLEKASGCYIHPLKIEYPICGRYINLERGIIIVNPEWDDKETINSIAHEWRHHQQYLNGITFENHTGWKTTEDYKKNIITYFHSNKVEMDALLFSQKIASSDTSTEWLEWVMNG
jgi:hypothetical protein